MPNENLDLPLDNLFKNLHSSKEGLSSREAFIRLQKYGFNEAHQNTVNYRGNFIFLG